MRLLEYSVTHPYPREKLFNLVTLALVLIGLPILILVNVVTVGYELVPTLHTTFTPNDTVPLWWTSTRLPSLLRPDRPPCHPKDIGQGDRFRLSPSLFEYKVLGTWRTGTFSPQHEGRIEYTDGSFDNCYPENIRFDYDMVEWTQTLTVGVACVVPPVRALLETQIVFAREHSKDYVGQYYGFDSNISRFFEEASDDYRKSVFGIFDTITTDSMQIISGRHLSDPVLSFCVKANISPAAGAKPRFFNFQTVYLNGTVNFQAIDNDLGELEIYRDSISNTMSAVQHAVHLDLGNITEHNIFANSSAVKQTFSPNHAPASIDPDSWARRSESFYYGTVPAPYRTWAEALREGVPENITLGLSPAQLPPKSTMVTNYLCPSYEIKSLSSFLSSIFVGTATMFMSAWAVWTFTSAIIARRMQEPCIRCTCNLDIPIVSDEEKDVGTHLPTDINP